MTDVSVRTASVADVPALNAIYNEYIVDSHVSFDTEPWTDDQRVAWFDQRISDGYPIVVAMLDDDVVGAAWSGPWRDKAAYRTTAETTVVLAPEHSGVGIGSMLVSELIDALDAADFTVSIPALDMKNAVMYCGTQSGRDVDKFKELGMETKAAQQTTSPIMDLPGLHFECRIVHKGAMDPAFLDESYQSFYPEKDYHTLYFGEILECYEL